MTKLFNKPIPGADNPCTMELQSQEGERHSSRWLSSLCAQRIILLLSLLIMGVGRTWANTYEWSHDRQKSTLSVTAAKGSEEASTYTGYSISYGDATYTSCIKMESATTITFTTSNAATITVGVALKKGTTYDDASKTELSLTTNGGTAVTANTGITSSTTGATTESGLEVVFSNVAAGTQVIKRTGLEEGVFYIKVVELTAYSVNYSSAHGTAPSSTSASSVTLPTLTEDGYTNTGWTADKDVTVGDDAETAGRTIACGSTVTLSEATTFTAVWTENICSAPTFSPTSGTYSAEQQVTLSSTTEGASIYYTTDGTTPSATNGTLYSGPITVSTPNTILAVALKDGYTSSSVVYATYNIVHHVNITTSGDDGYDTYCNATFNYTYSGETKSDLTEADVPAGTTINLVGTDNSAQGYLFNCWTFSDSRSSLWNSTQSDIEVTSDLTIYAEFVKGYSISATTDPAGIGTITFHDVNADWDFPSGTVIKRVNQITLIAPVVEGYTFVGWYNGETLLQTDRNIPAFNPSANINYTAKYEVTTTSTYSVLYDVNGRGNRIADATDVTMIPYALPQPTVDGYTFGGWYTDNNTFANAAVGGTTITANTTLYAKWTINKGNTVSFDGNDKTAVITQLQEPQSGMGIMLPSAYESAESITAPTDWTFADGVMNTGTYYNFQEAYFTSSVAAGNVLTQTATGLANGKYAVVLDVAVSYTADRGFECPTGNSLTQAFAGESGKFIPVYNRTYVDTSSEVHRVALVTDVTDGTLTYGLKNTEASGNWYLCKVISIQKITNENFLGWYTAATDGTAVGDEGENYWPNNSTTTLYAHWSSLTPSGLAVSPVSANVYLNTTSSPFTITTNSDGDLSVISSNSKVVAYFDDDNNLIITSNSSTATSTLTIAQNATSTHSAGEVKVTVNVVKNTMNAPSISCTNNVVTITPSVEGSTIYYTTDGSDPTTSSTRTTYTGSFTISADATIKAYASANNYDDSSVASQSVTYDSDYINYTLNAVDESGNVIKTIASGSTTEGTATVYYPIIFKEGNTYYILKESTSDYSKTFTATGTENVTYVADANIVAFIEGESGNTNVSTDKTYSNGQDGRVNAVNYSCRGLSMGTLPLGKYSFVANIISDENRTLSLRNSMGLSTSTGSAAAAIVCQTSTKGISYTDFTIMSPTSFVLNGATYSNVRANISAIFDYAYIIRQNAVLFTTQPVGGYFGVNSTATLSVAANAYYNGEVTPTYQWYSNTTNSTDGGTLIEGATSATYTPSTNSEATTYYYCIASYTEGGNTISATSDVVKVVVCPHTVSTPTIGNTDNTSALGSCYSPFYSLAPGESREFTFTAKGNGTNGWENWYLFAANEQYHQGDANKSANYTTYMQLRADRYDDVTKSSDGMTITCLENGNSVDAWSNFNADTKDAVVDVKIARNQNVLYTYYKMTSNTDTHRVYHVTYTRTISAIDATATDPIYLFFGINLSHIENFVASDVKAAYSVASAVDGENGTVAMSNADGIAIPEGTYVNAGDEIIYTATPATGYDDHTWTSDGTVGEIDGPANTYTIASLDKNTTVTVNLESNTLYFTTTNPSVMLNESGTATYTQDVQGVPTGDVPVYTVESTTGNVTASIVQEENSSAYTLYVTGTGTVTVAASCGGLSTTYTLTVSGVSFAQLYQIYNPNSDTEKGTHTQTITDASVTNITYSISDESYGQITTAGVTIDSNTGTISNIPAFDENKGGALVIQATGTVGGESKTATYVLTIPYKEYTWNFYKEGLTGDANNQVITSEHRLTTGTLVKGSNPGATSEVAEADNLDGVYYDGNDATLMTHLKKRKTWQDAQADATVQADANDAHNYWNYTFKTLRSTKHTDESGVYHYYANYANQSLFSYKNAVNGDNVRIIKDTQGLVFNCSADYFGINDNLNGSSQDIREQDRCVLLKGYSSFTIPHVTEGYYVKINWYRHSDNAGDQFRVTNAKDLDGKEINPDDVLRFTGSHYTHHSYCGNTILQAASTGDMTITIANANWTELYTIQVMPNYSPDLKLCEADVINKGTESASVATGTQNERDINDPAWYNNVTKTTSKLVSKIQTNAKGGGLISYAPDFYITGYAAQCNTWNGWKNTTVQAGFLGSAKCYTENNTENGVENCVAKEYLTVGSNFYPMHHVYNIEGEGTIKLTFRTHTGWDGEPHYTLSKQEVYVAVGQYSVQEYPFTWDFTKYHMDLPNAYNNYGGTSYGAMGNTYVNKSKLYGGWTAKSGKYDMDAYTTLLADSAIHAQADRNRPLFAQGAQLALGEVPSMHTVLETEGLKFTIPAVNNDNNSALTWATGEGNNGTTLDVITLNKGTITIPEVTKDMYVFVKGAQPTSTTNTKTSDVTFAQNADKDVYFYQAAGDADGNPADITLTFGTNATVMKIGVTDQVKTVAYHGWASESRAIDIDYNETSSFSANSKFYKLTSTNGWNTNYEVKTEGQIVELGSQLHVPAGTGIIIENKDCSWTPALKNQGENVKIPLFVPAVNVAPESKAVDLTGNLLKATTTKDQESATISPTKVTDGNEFYVLSNYYYKVHEDNSKISTVQNWVVPAFYRYLSSAKSVKNLAYLQFTEAAATSSAKALISKGFMDDLDDNDATAIENIQINDDSHNGYDAESLRDDKDVYYNINGQALSGKPSQRGVYIKNGKKVFIK